MQMVQQALKLQEQGNYQLGLILNELKRASRSFQNLSSMEGDNEAVNEGGIESQTKLYVGNIDYAATESELALHFGSYGHIEFVNIPINRYNGRARGFGFVTFAMPEEAERAMALNGSEFKGRQIQVNFAKERE
jgi:RNA recognition motif-containing protein